MSSNIISSKHIPFKTKVHTLQKTLLALSLILISFGGIIFGISVEVRSVLRIIKHSYQSHVESFLDLMMISSILQIISAGFTCFTACWKLLWTMYIAIGFTLCLMLLQLSCIVSVFYLMSEGTAMVNEHIYHAWYSWECVGFGGSCHNGYMSYVYYYMIPQTLISAVAIFVQTFSMLYVWRFISCLNEKKLRIWKSRELLSGGGGGLSVFDGKSMASIGTTKSGVSASDFKPNELLNLRRRGGRENSVDSLDFIENLITMRNKSGSTQQLLTTNLDAPDNNNGVVGPCSSSSSTGNNNNTGGAGSASTMIKAQIHCFEIDEHISQVQESPSATAANTSIYPSFNNHCENDDVVQAEENTTNRAVNDDYDKFETPKYNSTNNNNVPKSSSADSAGPNK